jgi:hypothetical protein
VVGPQQCAQAPGARQGTLQQRVLRPEGAEAVVGKEKAIFWKRISADCTDKSGSRKILFGLARLLDPRESLPDPR